VVPLSPVLPSVASGDQAAVRACLDRYGGLVWSLARRFSSSESEAEDAVQEIFVALWKSAARFDPAVAEETTFVAMIARRRLIDRMRRRSRRPETVGLPEGFDAETPGAVEKVEASVDARTATEALQTLDPERRRVLELSVWHGLSHREISSALELPLGTVKSHIRRGLAIIREHLERPVPGPSDAEATS